MASSAGEQLRARMDAMLAARGPGWRWSPLDLEVLDSAARHADRAAELQRLYDSELAGEARPTVLSKLSSEIRHNERRTIELAAMLAPPGEVPKSKRHQDAVNARHRRDRARREGTVVPMNRGEVG